MALNVIVTGAAGFIGSHTVDQLLAAGYSVWGVDNFRTGREENLAGAMRHPSFKLRELDVAEEKDFIDFAGEIDADVVIHLAALVSVPESISNPALNERLNFQATRIVSEAASRHKIARIVFASSAAVYGDPCISPIAEDTAVAPLSPYGSAKLASENLLFERARTHAQTVRCQRYFNVYGPRQDPSSPYSGVISIFLKHLMCNTPPTIFGTGQQTRDFISVFDVARANVIAATRQELASGVVNICSGRSTSIIELWRLLSQHYTNPPLPSFAPLRTGDIYHSCGRPDAALNALNFTASIDLAAGLAQLSILFAP